MDAFALVGIIGSVVGTGLALGISLAVPIQRGFARVDDDWRELQRAMDTFRREMQRLAERQAHVEGRLDGRPASAG